MEQKQKNLNKLSKLGNDILENSEILIYSDKMKSYKKLESFTKYCIANPSMRFWKALLNWSKFPFICISPVPPSQISKKLKDTYYLE